jgi:enamine deaminase RidA (YjgF/YER057c/UK114 family)
MIVVGAGVVVGYRESGTVTDIRRIGVAARYSDLVIHDGTAYFSGYVPETSLGLSVSEQTRDILGQIEQSLVEIGSDKSKLLQATIWLADIAFYNEMNAVWDAWVVPGQAPARACVEARLANPDYKLEIQVIAAL